MKGWFNEPRRHSLAARGIKSVDYSALALELEQKQKDLPRDFLEYSRRKLIPAKVVYSVSSQLSAKGKINYPQPTYTELLKYQVENLEYTPIRQYREAVGFGTEASMDIFRELTKPLPDYFGYIEEKLRFAKTSIGNLKTAHLYQKIPDNEKEDFLKKLKTLQSKVEKKVKDKERKELMLKSLELTEHIVNENPYSARQAWKKLSKKIQNVKPDYKYRVHKLTKKEYENHPAEKTLRAGGNMSYASTETYPGKDGVYDILVRDTKNKTLLAKMIAHEKEEVKLFNQLKKVGLSDQIAAQKAHEYNPVKINNAEVDKAFGDIGDPI